MNLVCPETKQALRRCSLEEARTVVARGAELTTRPPGRRPPIGPTETVMVRHDGTCAYPVVEGIPVLLTPERLVAPGETFEVDLSDPRWAEAYEEMAIYNDVATQSAERVETSDLATDLEPILEVPAAERAASFPHPRRAWLDATYELAAQADAYAHMAPVVGRRVLQVGGRGASAVKFLLAGADEAWVLSPMVDELAFGVRLAQHFGVEAGIRCVAGIAEQLPFPDETMDRVYTGSCLHHTETSLALAECARVLVPGGRFAAIEPWRAPFYGVGIKIFGKREKGVYCRPMSEARSQPLFREFAAARVVHHGAITRYPMIALDQLGLGVRPSIAWRVTRIDDTLCSAWPALRRTGSAAALLGTRAAS